MGKVKGKVLAILVIKKIGAIDGKAKSKHVVDMTEAARAPTEPTTKTRSGLRMSRA